MATFYEIYQNYLQNPYGGVNALPGADSAGDGGDGYATGGRVSQGLDYLMGIERRGYQEGSTLTDLFKRYEDIQTPSGPALDNPDFIPETALGNIERGISDFLKSDRGLKYGKDIPLDINDIYSFIEAQRRSFSPDLSQNYQGGNLYNYLQDFYQYKYGNPRIELPSGNYGYYDEQGPDGPVSNERENIFKSYFNQPYKYGLNQTTPTEDLINNLNTTTINTTAQTTPTVAEQMMSPEDALTPPAPDVNPLQQHFDQNQMLKDAVASGEITPEQYNELGGYDVQQTLSPGNPLLGGIGNLIGSIGYNAVQSYKDKQSFGDAVGDVYRNVKGGLGLISPELKQTYQNIIQQRAPSNIAEHINTAISSFNPFQQQQYMNYAVQNPEQAIAAAQQNKDFLAATQKNTNPATSAPASMADGGRVFYLQGGLTSLLG
jgi:hypothetical protein